MGEKTVRLFVSHGAKVVIADILDNLGHSLCKEIGLGENVSFIHCDITEENDVRNATDTTVPLLNMVRSMMNVEEDREVEEVFVQAVNLKGVQLKVDDIAEAVLYLASDETKYVSGLNLIVDGGFSTTNPTLSQP
ncbi:hypothetical protein IFM89_036673 [Coptis chinensis]|uniref:Uncharacterized protein n=1 Tax=Coptis chinensis TaxID=261450 RepID=A0A835LY64_9MAGN|nr:hypothetical protein IFM89_036673 [Coptis chinensis]